MLSWICQRGNNPTVMEMSTQGHPVVFNEQGGNPHTTAIPRISLYISTMKELPQYTQETWKWTRWKQIKIILRPEIPDIYSLSQVQKSVLHVLLKEKPEVL